ncbi:helix-turn-helix domain-containing protein [Methylocystis sp.]|uniref:helix-turn-helix domain-containing protein n=1 Tax=Methylocystis sp. TaxID=1911079 RepID=UPI003DA33957
MARRYNAGLVKRHRSYSIPEAAALLGVHKHTISRWIDDGLPVIERKRPLLIHGTDLRAFIKARQPKKQPCRPGEMFCVRCSAPKRPAYDVADFIPTKAGRGLLRGLCPDCGGLIHRFVTEAKIGAVCGDLSVARPTAQSRMCDSPAPLSNVAFEKDRT